MDQMAVNSEVMRKEMRYETRKFVVQLQASAGGAFAAGAAWVKYFQ